MLEVWDWQFGFLLPLIVTTRIGSDDMYNKHTSVETCHCHLFEGELNGCGAVLLKVVALVHINQKKISIYCRPCPGPPTL